MPATIPAPEHLHNPRFNLHTIKDFEVCFDNIPPDSGTLSHFWVALRKETQTLATLNNHFAQLSGRCRIVNGN